MLVAIALMAGCSKSKADIESRVEPKLETPVDNETPRLAHQTDGNAPGAEDAVVGTEAHDPADQIEADPVGFIKRTLSEARKLETFRTLFLRQERLGLGLFKELKPVENIIADYRDDPYSVRFTWTDEKSEYRQCVYIEGENRNRVALLPRRGLFGLKPGVANYAPKLGVTFHKTRNPITDFGPRRMMERTLDRIENAIPHGEVLFNFRGTVAIGPAEEPCYYLEMQFPAGDEFPCKLQDLYVHTKTHLPVATYLWLTDRNERTDDTLDAMYLFSELERDAEVTNEHFIIDANMKEQARQEGLDDHSAHRAETSAGER